MKTTDTRVSDFNRGLEERKRRCQERLDAEPKGYMYFAIVGARFEADYFALSDVGFIRGVKDSPNVFDLAGVLDDMMAHGAIQRYAPLITYELAVASDPEFVDTTMAAAWALTASLRIRTGAEFLVPAAATHSWSTMAALKRGSCSIQLIEDFPKARQIGEQRIITSADCDWVARHFRTFMMLYASAAFRLAADCFSTYPHNANLRMSTAELWAGIESLFAVNSELRFRISALVASFLEPHGDARLELYRCMKSLYDFRSKAVHGADLTDEALTDHIVQVRLVLLRLLTRITEMEKLPTTDELEKALFCIT